MARKYQRKIKAIIKLCGRVGKKALSILNNQIVCLLRTIFSANRRRGLPNEGFILPTVVLVSLIVVLLTTAILFRAFDRSKNASNVRVNEIALKAAAPAIDRGKAKIAKLFADPRLPRTTPSDSALTNVISANINEYTFGDETQLTLYYPVGGTPGASSTNNSNTAWKYPVDTDNNGLYDSFTLYGIYFRTPTTTRSRSPLESRAQPMNEGSISGACTSSVATSANLVGAQGWYKVGSNLERSLFVYTVTVPITSTTGLGTSYEVSRGNQGFSSLEYEQDLQTTPLSNNAVIYDNDLEITPGAGLKLNGRVFTNSNLLTKGYLKGSNGLSTAIRFYLVSSPTSCYFKQENSKIVVGGNVVNTRVSSSSTGDSTGVQVDLFYQNATSSTYATSTAFTAGTYSNYLNPTNVTTTTNGTKAGYNDDAYAQRIQRLVTYTNTQYAPTTTGANSSLPTEVINAVTSEMSNNPSTSVATAQTDQLTIYFKKCTRRVPYGEVPAGSNGVTTPTNYSSTSPIQGSGNLLRPVDSWVFPYSPTDGTTSTGYAGLSVNTNGNTQIYLPASNPAGLETQTTVQENFIGDRILVGNNLPEYWFPPTTSAANNPSLSTTQFTTSDDGESSNYGQNIYQSGGTTKPYYWDGSGAAGNTTVTTTPRQRYSQASYLDDLGDTGRNGFWELSAAQNPSNPLDVVGGLRVITGSGIYLPSNYNPKSSPTFTSSTTIVWPDTAAMALKSTSTTNTFPLPYDSNIIPPAALNTPYLQMRSTVIYHYDLSAYNTSTPSVYQTPIACISSYYDPTNSTTALNRMGLPYNTGTTSSPGYSHNGIVYKVPSTTSTTYYQSSFKAELDYQATLVYPGGRPVNEQLASALNKINGTSANSLSLSEQSALDSAVCSMLILTGSGDISPSTSIINHGAIYETAFLDARQVKEIDSAYSYSKNVSAVDNGNSIAAPSTSTTYNLDVELRQPLEVRATVLDLNQLRTTAISGGTYSGEFMFPNSGIIYATRDDALPDVSSLGTTATKFLTPGTISIPTVSNNNLALSSEDFMLDPTRRPNGIMLINGSNISRNSVYVAAEKGMTLASNIPVYIQGNFNLHNEQEFLSPDLLSSSWDNFYTRSATNFDKNFACRAGQFSGCSTGEPWRAATVLADAITALSSNFQFGYRTDGDYNLRDYGSGYYNYTGSTSSPVSTVGGNSYPIGYDLNGINGIETTPITLNEKNLQLDINNNGNMTDMAVNTFTEATITSSIATRLNGFWDNNFVTSRNFTDTTYSVGNSATVPTPLTNYLNPQNSSYFNNYVTPIQRRVNFSEYVMEMCAKQIVTACQPTDWYVGYDLDNNLTYTTAEKQIPANQLLNQLAISGNPFKPKYLWAGTTVNPATDPKDPNVQSYPRRVAFLRYTDSTGINNTLITGSPNLNSAHLNYLVLDNLLPVALGIYNHGKDIRYFPFSTNTLTIPNSSFNSDSQYYSPYSTTNTPDTNLTDTTNTSNNLALWFQTNNAGAANYSPSYPLFIQNTLLGTTATEQPLLVPVLQIQYPTVTSGGSTITNGTSDDAAFTHWYQIAPATTMNLVFAQGDSPSRPNEFGGGLENFVRFLEDWPNVNLNISGAFIEFKRASFASAPFQPLYSTGNTNFGYPQTYDNVTNGTTITNASGAKYQNPTNPFYVPPLRAWGYDVALLSQLPDLFSQRFTSPSPNPPNEFYREVGRDDNWVQTLLCGAQTATGGYDTASSTNYGTGYTYAISQDQRNSASCPQ